MNCNPGSLQMNWGSEDYEAGDLWGAIQFSSTDKRDYSASLVPFPKTSTRLINSISFILRKNLFGLNTITSLPHTQLSKGRGKLEIELKSTWGWCWRDLTRSSQKPASCVVVEPSPLRQIIVHWVRLKIQQWRQTRSHEADFLRQWMPILVNLSFPKRRDNDDDHQHHHQHHKECWTWSI